jgi:hypothetical protein
MTNYNTTKTELLAFHKVKIKFFPVMEIESENPEDIEIYEFSGQNFKLVAN